MKRIAFLCLMMMGFLSGCSDLDSDKVYFFTKTECPYCQKAEQYISKQYPNLNIEYKNIKTPANEALFAKCARKADIPKSKWGTPLICMGDNVFLGWSDKTKSKFDELAKNFQK